MESLFKSFHAEGEEAISEQKKLASLVIAPIVSTVYSLTDQGTGIC